MKKTDNPDILVTDYTVYNKDYIIELKKELKKVLKKDRYEHTLGVAYTAGAMAMAYGMEPFKAVLAGLLHDCAKCIDDEKKVELCQKNNIEITPYEKEHLYLLHAKLGAFLAREKYHVDDDDIYQSILYHTTGTENMSLLQKIIFTADYIEPGRKMIPGLTKIRQIAFQDIDLCMYKILETTISYLKEKGLESIDENTLIAYRYYKKEIERRGNESGK